MGEPSVNPKIRASSSIRVNPGNPRFIPSPFSMGVQRLVAGQSRAARECRVALDYGGSTPLWLCGGAIGEIAECAARTKGAGLLCRATVNLRVGPAAREKRRPAARSPKAGATLDAPILLIHWTQFQSHAESPMRRAQLVRADSLAAACSSHSASGVAYGRNVSRWPACSL